MSNIVFEKAQERVVKSYKMSFKELFLSSKFFSFSTYLLLLIGVFITLYTILYTNNYTLFHKYYIYFSASFALLTVFALLLSSELDENTSGLV